MKANREIQKTLWGLGGFALVLAGALFYGLCVRTSKPTFSDLTWGVGGALSTQLAKRRRVLADVRTVQEDGRRIDRLVRCSLNRKRETGRLKLKT